MAMRLPSSPTVPVGLSTFCGRRRELLQLRTVLATERLVTVTGTGGVGKTRVVMEYAQGAGFEFPDGVWVVELARIESPALVDIAIADVVSASQQTQAEPLERVARRLGQGRQLLILDNCEHVLESAAAAALQLLTECPSLSVLATSREALNVRGEREVRLPPLRLTEDGDADLEVASRSEAVELFCDRAHLADSAEDLPPNTAAEVAEICRRLDGLPLALELAAAWTPVLSLREIARRLDDSLAMLNRNDKGRPSRHRSMRAALDWSERLLTPAQALAFARLSVFVGGFSLDAAESVLDGREDGDISALDLVTALVARSLVTADTGGDMARYRLLEPVRQYAAEQLRGRSDDERETRRRHLAHLTELAETAEEPLLGGPDDPWLRRLDMELANIRTALAWGFAEGDELAARLTTALRTFAWHRRLFDEGVGWALQAAEAGGRQRARALLMAGWFASERGDGEAGARYLDDAYQLAADGDWRGDLVMVLVAKCLNAYVRGDLDEMSARGDEGLQLARAAGDEAHIMWALWGPGVCLSVRGAHQRALDLFTEALAIARRLDNNAWRSVLASCVIDTAIDLGDDAAALRALRAEMSKPVPDDPAIEPYLVEAAGILAIRRGHYRRGLRLLGASHAASQRGGYRSSPDEVARRRQWIETARRGMSEIDADLVWESGLALPHGGAVEEARAAASESAAAIDAVNAPLAGGSQAFVREGEFWSLTYAGVVARVRNGKGLRDLAALVATPGRGVAAVDLVSTTRSVGATKGAGALGLHVEGDTGETLDAAARTEYRARLVDLDEEISDADAANDLERASRAREEQHFVLAELGAAVGLGGRPRRGLDPAERARKAVTWRVRDAIHRIEAAHPALGHHLRRSVRTGSLCMYDPAEPTEWRVELGAAGH
jgi:predicted ATPase